MILVRGQELHAAQLVAYEAELLDAEEWAEAELVRLYVSAVDRGGLHVYVCNGCPKLIPGFPDDIYCSGRCRRAFEQQQAEEQEQRRRERAARRASQAFGLPVLARWRAAVGA